DMAHPGLEHIYRITSTSLTAIETQVLQKHKEWDHCKTIHKELMANSIKMTNQS
ncbi:hypothetical protein NEFER01_2267, partial [Nematocida sp. LUAm1]